MKLWILCCLVAAVTTNPTDGSPGEAEFYIDNYSDKDGFRYEFKQDDGTQVEAQGKLKNGALAIKGIYSYTVGNVTYVVRYVADQNGYRPTIEERPSEEAPGYAPNVVASLLGQG